MLRKKEIKVRLTEDEFNGLNEKVAATTFSREEFIRRCIRDVKFKEAPPNELPEFIRLLRRLNANAGQILLQLNSGGIADALAIKKLIADNRALEQKVLAIYTPYLS
jgi:hypothetical protein